MADIPIIYMWYIYLCLIEPRAVLNTWLVHGKEFLNKSIEC